MIGQLIHRFKQEKGRHGVWLTVCSLSLRLLRRTTGFTRFKGMRLCQIRPEAVQMELSDRAYTWGFLNADQLERVSHSAEYELDPDFLRIALEKGDACFGVLFHGRVLAAYSWYSSQPTLMEDGLYAHCSQEYVYMYKAFTHPAHRGYRLYGFGVAQAVREYLQRGAKGIVCHVHEQNVASLKGLQRLGFEEFQTFSYFRGHRFFLPGVGSKFREISELVFPSTTSEGLLTQATRSLSDRNPT